MVEDKSRSRLPPYVSYRTFRNFVEGLRQSIPSRIDRSYWGNTMSGSTGTQLTAALRFLGLIDTLGKPSARLRLLAVSNGEQRAAVLNEVFTEAFTFVLPPSLDIQSATHAQLEEVFRDRFQLTDDVRRKCIKFFIELASDAGIMLSPFITKRTRAAHTSTGTKVVTKKTGNRTSRNLKIPQDSGQIPDKASLTSWNQMLLTKFPTFDPTWPDEVKLKWFSAFDELMKRS